jgi:hypothetical protein
MNTEPQKDYEQILAQALRLDTSAQKNLIADLTAHLNREPDAQPATKKRSIMELQGIFKGVWKGLDAQEYVNQERDEWAKRDEEREKELWGG